ncbi:MAG: hypothetical protein VR72_18280 [Clostridiaceae bacterium BRH_c20a]|nr:MAG: hypothetical protein VR72_18280 [Clostridiaceae bacterium BRH_c20a]
MKKGDYLIIVFLLIFAGLSWLLVNNLWKENDSKQVIIEVDGVYYDTIEVWVNDETVICPREICVQTGKISFVGQSIVCLPNKTVIYITSQGVNSSKVEPIVDEIVF